MKHVLIALALLTMNTLTAQAFDLANDRDVDTEVVGSLTFTPATAFIQSITADSCMNYSYVEGSNYSRGYACGSYPRQVQGAEYYSTTNALDEANAKIADLSRRLAALEKKLFLMNQAQ